MEGSESPVIEDPLLERLRVKHAELHVNHISDVQRAKTMEGSLAYKKMGKLPPSTELLSDEVAIALNEIGTLCDEHGVPRVKQLLKDVRAMMNRQLREAYSYLEKGYVSAFHRLEEEAEEARKRREMAQRNQEREAAAREASRKELCSFSERRSQNASERSRSELPGAVPRLLSVKEALSTTTSFFAETVAVLLRCEVVRIYLYDEYENLNCCARFPFSTTQSDPMSGTHLELMLAKELHRTVCRKCIAVNGKGPQHITLSERDREAMEEELEQSGWKSMTSCLIFPIFSNEGFGRAYGMIHAVNKQGVAADRPGVFDENDEVLMSVTTRLLGCLLTRYPVKYFMLPVGDLVQQCAGSSFAKEKSQQHLPPLLVNEVEGAAEVGNKSVQMCTRVLLYRAPINAIYQTRSLRKKARKLEALNMIDKALSTVEFDLSALEELWRAGHEENTVMYQRCQELNEQVNTQQVLLRNVLDGIGASRAMRSLGEVTTYLQVLELYARQENIPMITEAISQALLNCRYDGPVPPELKGVDPGRLSPNEALRIERRIAQTPAKLKFGAAEMPNVRTYSCDPQKKREQVQFFNDLAEKRALESTGKFLPNQGSRYEADTKATVAKKVNQRISPLVYFGPTDYASKRPFQLGSS
ncbi:hypothetical protein DQ04_00071070 [Trypanosoma grayi]|uniref:hypothetical protein n=1 Tax=Trypanosoma grayi TaxID=71804 RepID=UPI0004F3FC9A|nr:hypothetical protein DQ04_00071070 [Trypanosoma grayi]KEG15439.1 hypothetical protein DQ04_00071070 [Trypanosoma grayi]